MKLLRKTLRHGLLALAATLAMPALAEVNPEPIGPRDAARWSAVADSVSTHIGLAAGSAVEANPLVATSPAGLLALFAAKLGAISYTDTLPERQRLQAQRQMSSLWSGMSANNLAIAAGAGPLAIPVGLLAGYLVYQKDSLQPQQAIAPLPLGMRATDGEAVARMSLLAVRRANPHGERSQNAPLELVVMPGGAGAGKSDAVWRPDGSKYFIGKHLGEIAVTPEAHAHAVRSEPAEAPGAVVSRKVTIGGWRYSYAVRRLGADGSVDASAAEEQILVDGQDKPQRGQKLIQHRGQTYALVRKLGAQPIVIDGLQQASAAGLIN